MGSPLALVLANIFMGFHNGKWLNEYNFNKPKFYLRYVDDILATFDKGQDSFLDVFISGINNQISHFKHITNRPIQTFF